MTPSLFPAAHRWHLADPRPFFCGSRESIDLAVVIPCLAEMPGLLDTLVSLARNPPEELARTLVVCVVNHREDVQAEDPVQENNRQTVAWLRRFAAGEGPPPDAPPAWRDRAEPLSGRGLRIACLDAASPGQELPKRGGGVGLARRIGMNRALGLVATSGDAPAILASLDGDTLVEPTYLGALRRTFASRNLSGAVVSFAHQASPDPAIQDAICTYELFLRYYVLGLAWAGSPYAFFSIGSALACTARGYAAVRGMPVRQGGEDFYFLNKLAKTGAIGWVQGTAVYPSPRPSCRAPFGTGQRVRQLVAGGDTGRGVYHPECFAVLKRWLALVRDDPGREAEALLAGAAAIHPALAAYLEEEGFAPAWRRVQGNSRRPEFLHGQFRTWFDGFRTWKLVRHLRSHGFPDVDMFEALPFLLSRRGTPIPAALAEDAGSTLSRRLAFLAYMRERGPC